MGELYDYEIVGICSHHSDYRLAWSINATLHIQLEKAETDFKVSNKKGQLVSSHSMYEFKDEENLIEYYLIKNKQAGKFLIPEKPAVDYFLFLCENYIWDTSDLTKKLKENQSILGVFEFDPEELDSAQFIVFN